MSRPIYVHISFLHLRVWTGPFERILIMLSVFSLESGSAGLSCSFQMSPRSLKRGCLCLHNPGRTASAACAVRWTLKSGVNLFVSGAGSLGMSSYRTLLGDSSHISWSFCACFYVSVCALQAVHLLRGGRIQRFVFDHEEREKKIHLYQPPVRSL